MLGNALDKAFPSMLDTASKPVESREVAMKRPLIAVALCYGAGVVLGHFLEAPLAGAFTIAILFTLAALFSKPVRPLALPVLLVLTGWLNMSSRLALISPHDLRILLTDDSTIIACRGRVVSTPVERVSTRNDREHWRTLAELEVNEVRVGRGDWQPAFGRMMSRTFGHLPEEIFAGQTVEVTGVANRPRPPVAEGVFDYARYLRQRGIHYELKVESQREWSAAQGRSAPPISDRFRAWGQRTLARGLPEQDEALRLQWAMLLGWETALTAEVSEPFMRSGTMHIFAISGLHIALIAGIFVALLRALTVPRVLCGLIVIPIIWFYTAATGWQASAIRSTVMMSIIILGWSLKRPSDLLNSLAMAACVILVWQPEQLFQAGFQLSFFVVLSIALLSPGIERWRSKIVRPDPLLPYELRPWWQRMAFKAAAVVWTFLATSFAALLGSIPLIAYYFHLFTPGSLLANLVVVPASSLALMSGLGALLTGEWLPGITELLNHSGWFWMRSMVFLSDTVADAPFSWIHIRAPGPLFFTLYYGILLTWCAGWFRHPTRRWIAIGAAFALSIWWGINWQRARSWHKVTALPLNGGHTVFVQPRSARDWLFDCGDETALPFTLKPFLQANGVNRLANFVLTHGDARQAGGAALLQETFPVRRAWTSPVSFRSIGYREALSQIETRTDLCRCVTNNLRVATWKFLHPQNTDRFALADDNAVVALGTFDGVRVLLASDLGRAGQSALATRHPDLRADIVFAGLPTRGEPFASDWLAIVRPKLIVVIDSEFPATRRAPRELERR
jgi:competence protein ComEC